MKRYWALALLLLATVAYGATTYTTNYNLAKPGDGDQNYGSLIRGNFDTIDTQLKTNADSTSNHIADTTAAHAASAISATVGANICTTSDTVQEFLTCLDGVYDPNISGVVLTTGNQLISGVKTFSDSPILSATPNALLRTSGGVVQATTFTAESPLTTVGDILGHDGSSVVRLAVGTDGQVLTADSGEDSGLIWATPVVDLSSATGILATANGGTGQNSTAVFPTSGTVVTRDATETLTNKTVTGATLSLDDTDSAFNLGLVSTSTLSADRSITFDVNGSNRSVELSGNIVLGGTLTTGGSLTTNQQLNLSMSGATSLTLPTTGTVATLTGTETLTNKDISSATNTYRDASASQSGAVTTGTQTLAGNKTFTGAVSIGSSSQGAPLSVFRDANAGDSTNVVSSAVGNSGANQGQIFLQYTNAAATGSPSGIISFQPRNNANSSNTNPGNITFTKDSGADTGKIDVTANKVLVQGYQFASYWTAPGSDCAASPCSEGSDPNGMMDDTNRVTRSSTGVYTMNFTSGYWSSGPNCIVSPSRGGAKFCLLNTSGASTTSYALSCYNNAGTLTDTSFVIMCHGAR
ncbi:MAG: hypothetical protein E6R04_04740 [Spirochaetes bacterium]|nr:MAG: hypothetical protein E6R04_04740 [Spirochaetota bacterium]